MSQETSQWLNQNVLVGFTDQRGNAWHYRSSDQGAESNHYPGAIPVGDVKRRLFHWTAKEVPAFIRVSCKAEDATNMTDDGRPYRFQEIPERKAIVRSDTMDVLGIHSDGYHGHDYGEWLVGNVRNILRGGELEIGSAGLLKNGARAWVQVEMPENLTSSEGVAFRPNLLAATSFDGSLATTYKRTVTVVVCDNTLECGLGERGETFRLKHTRNSGMRIKDAQEALGIVSDTADAFQEELSRLVAWKVSEAQWARLMDKVLPIPGSDASGRSRTMATNKRDQVELIYRSHAAVGPFKGTAWGVVQAFNTYAHHYGIVRGAERAERNMVSVLDGRMANADAEVLAALATV